MYSLPSTLTRNSPNLPRRLVIPGTTICLLTLAGIWSLSSHSSHLWTSSSHTTIESDSTYTRHPSYALPSTQLELDLSSSDPLTPGRIGQKGFWLKDLGPSADSAFDLGEIADSADGYVKALEDFVDDGMPKWMGEGMKKSLRTYFDDGRSKEGDSFSLPSMLDYTTIHQTDKKATAESEISIIAWSTMNDGSGSDSATATETDDTEMKSPWSVEFYDDTAAWDWMKLLRSPRSARTKAGRPVSRVPTRRSERRRSESSGAEIEEAGERERERARRETSLMEWAWTSMRRGVLRADYFRYLVILFEGGVYSDIDTLPLTPISTWGKLNPVLHDISRTDGPAWWTNVKEEPSVVIGVDVDVHMLDDWANGWPRPLGFCQWTLTGSPHHPIYLDAVRRVVNATQYIEDYAERIPEMIQGLRETRPDVEGGWEWRVNRLEKEMEDRVGILEVMEHTGPGIWTDSVLAYLKARYGVSWHDLRGLSRPLRIGDVLILPETAFSPGGQPDFHADGMEDPQAAVVHDFRGSWKSGGM